MKSKPRSASFQSWLKRILKPSSQSKQETFILLLLPLILPNPRIPTNPLQIPSSHTNPNSSRNNFSQKATTSNWENADKNVIKDDGGLQEFPTLVGTCPFMCPEEEMARREKLRDLAIFERLKDNPVKNSANLAVKKFYRTITTRDVKASDVQPVSVLEYTLNYLLDLQNSSDCPFGVIHDFIFDRTRCLRQDLSMQNAMGDQVIHMYERMVRILALSCISYGRYKLQPYAMYHLSKFLMMKESDVESLCLQCGLEWKRGSHVPNHQLSISPQEASRNTIQWMQKE